MNASIPSLNGNWQWLTLAPLLWPLLAGAALPEPDTLIYGAVSIAGRPATNANVVVEARRSATDALLATYRMTSDPRGQEFYALNLERNTQPDPGALASITGESIHVVLLENGSKVNEQWLVLPSAGISVRLDLGPSLDLNGNGVSDGWEQLNPDGDLASDLDGDGLSKLGEYIAGTHPSDSNSAFRVSILRNDDIVRISFLTRRAEGVGYDGRTRYYALEYSTNFAGWYAISNLTSIPGHYGEVNHFEHRTQDPSQLILYRGRTWLEGP